MSGIVYLVGAGPGDPGLLTVRGRDLIESADAIVYDRLVNPSLLTLNNRHAFPNALSTTLSTTLPSAFPSSHTGLYYVGKRDGDPRSVDQETITALLIQLAQQGKRVVRLKGGDPFVFGRGGEEAVALKEAGVAYEIVPGVTSAIAVPAYAGIPVTYRGMASMVTFVTANADPARLNAPVDWRAVGQIPGTVVLLMAAKTFVSVAPLMIEGGRPGNTPAAAVEWGTYPIQRTVVATLETLAARMAEESLGAPVSIIIGEVVQLREQIEWFNPHAHEQISRFNTIRAEAKAVA